MRVIIGAQRAVKTPASVISIRDARVRKVQRLKTLVRSGRYEPNLIGIVDGLERSRILQGSNDLDAR